MTQTSPLIHSRMIAILADVGAIEKGQTAQAGKGRTYQFRGIDDVMNTLHELFAVHQVYVTSEVLSQETSMHKYPESEAYHHKVVYRFTFHASDGSEVSSEVIGESIDGQDKGMNQTYSSAYKECMFKAFCIPTADQKDSDQVPKNGHTPPPPKPKATTSLYTGETKPNTYKTKCHLCTQEMSDTEGIMAKLVTPEHYKKDGQDKERKWHYFHTECYEQATSTPPSEPTDSPISPEDIEQIQALFEKRGIKVQGQTKWLKEAFGVEVVSQLSDAQAEKAIKSLSQAQ